MAADQLRVTVLGCGTSVGVPCIGQSGWGLCDPNEPLNRRQRSALLIQSESTTILVDAGADIRNQLLPLNIMKLDAILITHTHADHVAGLDDLRGFYWPHRKKVPIYATNIHAQHIKARIPYMFEREAESPDYFTPPLILHEISAGQQIQIGDINIDIMHQDHGITFSLGFIFNNLCGYSTDVNYMPDENFEKLSGIPLWIVESLREKEHPAHAHYDLTFSWIKKVQPGRAVLTHLGIEADYQTLRAICPENVEPGYDGMVFILPENILPAK